jgi:hypothetical protein
MENDSGSEREEEEEEENSCSAICSFSMLHYT